MTDHILATKLVIPTSPTALVLRSRLSEPDQGASVILVCAPAGYGKTTLIASWAKARQTKVAWISLDADDNDPLRFMNHFVSAIQSQFPGLGSAVTEMLDSAPPPPIGGLMRSLANQFCDLPEPLCVILDDLHTVQDASVHKAIASLVEHQAPQLQLIFASRCDPPFSLARLRGQGKLLEYRTKDLRFTLDEADQFCNQVMDFGLPAAQVESLANRTEGWIVGLQLAAVSLRHTADKAGFIESFAGDDRHITDFLLDEVLRTCPEETQNFLLYTSLLERFSAPLCDAVTLRSDSRAMLDEIERSNMFVLGLDHQRVWYRYHHLFNALLQSRLRQAAPALVKSLHRRASQWFSQQGLIPEAIGHAIKGADFDVALALIEQHGSDLFAHGQINQALVWARELPPATLARSPRFSLTCAWGHFYADNLVAMEKHIHSVELCLAGFHAAPIGSNERAMLGQAALLRGCRFAYCGQIDAAIAHLQQAHASFAPGRALNGVAAISLGVCYFVSGNYVEAQALLERHATLADAKLNVLIPVTAVLGLARMQYLRGRLQQAKQLVEQVLQECTDAGWQDFPACGMLHISLGELAYEMNDLAAAERHLQRGVEMTANGIQYGNAWGHVLLAQTRWALGAAENSLNPERELALRKYSGRFVVDLPPLSAAIGRMYLSRGRQDLMAQWCESAQLSLGETLSVGREAEYLVLARYFIWQGKAEQAALLLERLRQASVQAGRVTVTVEVLLLQALALHAGRNGGDALPVLRECIDLARNTGLLRLFLDEGAPLADLLKKMVRAASYSADALALLSCFPNQASAEAAETSLSHMFSKKERQVVALLVKGDSNQEMADSLFVSLNTLKSHMKNVYAKLGVNRRFQAIEELRKLGLECQTEA
ncbi:MAG: LuxR C-terminal-related transcriptional regulator [Pseudomonadota bacterium]